MGVSTIAVIMSTYAERPGWLRASIESILSQTFTGFAFYIVLDNPQNDELNAIVRSYADRDERIVVLPNERNRGLTASLNRAIAASKEPYIARMDADDIARPDRLQKELDFLRAQGLDLVATGADILADGEVVPGRKLPTIFTGALAEIEGFTNVFFHPTWLAKRGVYEALGGYREIASCEDYDFVLRALQAGFKLGRMEEMLLVYRFAEGGISSSSWLTQEKSARFLRSLYREGTSIAGTSPEEIDAASRASSEAELREYASAKQDYDRLFAAAGSGKLLAALGIAIPGMAKSGVFRGKMRDAFYERMMIPRACKRHEGRRAD